MFQLPFSKNSFEVDIPLGQMSAGTLEYRIAFPIFSNNLCLFDVCALFIYVFYKCF